ncbi:MAG TPA: DUF3263 domain-containing protein [Catenuloplanes sp.]|jgi:hypothetical protein
MARADVPAPEPPTHDDDLAPNDPAHDDPAPDDEPAGAGGARVPTPRAQADPKSAVLTEREARILAFESKWWKHAGSKEQAIRDAFDLSATRYYQLLNGLLDNPAALEHDPVLIGRLRRLRSTRARVRRR